MTSGDLAVKPVTLPRPALTGTEFSALADAPQETDRMVAFSPPRSSPP